MDPQGCSNRSLRSRKSSIGRFAEETVDGVLHVLLRLPRHPARAVLLLLPAGDVLSIDERGGMLMMVMLLSPAGNVLNTNDKGVMIMMLCMALMMLLPAGELLYADNRGGDVRVQRSGSSYSSCQSAPGGGVETPSSSNSLGQCMMLAWACGRHFLRSFFFNRRVGGRA